MSDLGRLIEFSGEAPSGRVMLPSSKSLTNRALVMAAAADGGEILNPLRCRDTRVLSSALQGEGWRLSEERSRVVLGTREIPPGRSSILDLEDSGTGARLLIGLLSTVEGQHVIDGSPRLRQRPMMQLLGALVDLGAEIRSSGGGLPVGIRGTRISGGKLSFEPRVSSQFVSSLLMAAPRFVEGLQLEILGRLPSAPYLELTRDVMRSFGASVMVDPSLRYWRVAPGGLRPAGYEVEADFSAAAFPLAALALVGGWVELGPFSEKSAQGDRRIVEILASSGMEFRWEKHDGRASESTTSYLVARGSIDRVIEADLFECPDLFPALVAVAACRFPGSVLEGLEHLKYKESHRLEAMKENLESLGARFELDGHRVKILRPVDAMPGKVRPVRAHSDHRIAMAMAVTAIVAGPLELDDPDCVAKSFPNFWDLWDRMMN